MIAKDGRRKTQDGKGGRLVVSFSVFLLLTSVFQGCGKKGPPLAPLNFAPGAPQAVTARRLADTVYIQLTVPDKSMSGQGEFSVDHLDVYAVTVAPGTKVPITREFLVPEYVVAKIPIQPPLDPDAPEPETPDPRPRPGDTLTFVEKLTDAQLAPTPLRPSKQAAADEKAKKKKNGTEPPPAGAATPPPPAGPPVLTRFYMVMGVPKKGRGSVPSARLEVPLLEAPSPPRSGTASADQTSVTITWQPPPTSSDEVSGLLYNVYADTKDAKEAKEPPKPLNDKPLEDTAFSRVGAEPGKEQCFVVRSVAAVGTTFQIESDPSAPICVTPKDTFPPAAPKGLAAVASAGVVNLIWDANTEADLAGYVVLRGDAGGATLQPLMAEPIKDTRYSDRTAQAGVRYAYQIVAVDKTGNRSAPSNRVEEAAR